MRSISSSPQLLLYVGTYLLPTYVHSMQFVVCREFIIYLSVMNLLKILQQQIVGMRYIYSDRKKLYSHDSSGITPLIFLSTKLEKIHRKIPYRTYSLIEKMIITSLDKPKQSNFLNYYITRSFLVQCTGSEGPCNGEL